MATAPKKTAPKKAPAKAAAPVKAAAKAPAKVPAKAPAKAAAAAPAKVAAKAPAAKAPVKAAAPKAAAPKTPRAQSNAASGGTISVGVREVDATAEVSVADTGEGVPPEIAEQLGRQPVRARREGVRSARDAGLGVGLLISRQIAVAHGGELVVESVPGEGTTVRFTVPLAPAT